MDAAQRRPSISGPTQQGKGDGSAAGATLPRLRVRVLGQELLRELRTAILEGGFPPGGRLIENDIAEQMGVSRAPVREAIRALEREGLVEIFPHRGAVVVGVSEDEFERIYELRALIEQIAFERTAALVTPELVEALEAQLDSMRLHVDAEAIDQLIEDDVAFHRLVVEASGYQILKRLWDSLVGLTRVRTLQALAHPGRARYFLPRTISEHEELLDSLRQGDGDRARELVGEHIVKVGERMREVPSK